MASLKSRITYKLRCPGLLTCAVVGGGGWRGPLMVVGCSLSRGAEGWASRAGAWAWPGAQWGEHREPEPSGKQQGPGPGVQAEGGPQVCRAVDVRPVCGRFDAESGAGSQVGAPSQH